MRSSPRPILVTLVVFADLKVRVITKRGMENKLDRTHSGSIVSQKPLHRMTVQKVVYNLTITMKPEIPSVEPGWTIELEPTSYEIDFVTSNWNKFF